MINRENKVELIGYYGGDLAHALSAWTSTSRELTEEKRNRLGKMLKMLAEAKHHTPFEKSTLHFLVTCDTASHIHILKHRIGVSVNGESYRYREVKEDKFYVPMDWYPGISQKLIKHMLLSYDLYHRAIKELQAEGFSRQRAKESARFFLPYANQITLDISFNFRSFMHFLGLRMKPDAQIEIKQIAEKMLQLTRETGAFDLSLLAFGY